MNRKTMTAVGVFFSMAPFTLMLGHYVLYYALFGYGMIILVTVMESRGKFDWARLSIAVLASASLAFQVPDYFYPLHFAFQAVVAVESILGGKSKLASGLSIAILVLFPAFVVFFSVVYLGLLPDVLAWKLASSLYPLLTIGVFAAESWNGRSKNLRRVA